MTSRHCGTPVRVYAARRKVRKCRRVSSSPPSILCLCRRLLHLHRPPSYWNQQKARFVGFELAMLSVRCCGGSPGEGMPSSSSTGRTCKYHGLQKLNFARNAIQGGVWDLQQTFVDSNEAVQLPARVWCHGGIPKEKSKNARSTPRSPRPPATAPAAAARRRAQATSASQSPSTRASTAVPNVRQCP